MQDSPTGITAKVADFGLSREMQSTSRIETRTCGTITHMPPELLSQDVVSKARPSPPACLLKSPVKTAHNKLQGLETVALQHLLGIVCNCPEGLLRL